MKTILPLLQNAMLTYQINPNLSLDGLVSGFIGLLLKLASGVGGILFVVGAIGFVVNLMNQNNDGQTKFGFVAIGGFALVGLGHLLTTAGILVSG